MKKVILDCDPGHDDAFAIMLAAGNLDLLGVTTVGGNSGIEKVTKNALKTLEVIGRPDIPVHRGHAGPMVAALVTAPQFHGESGLDGPVLPEPRASPRPEHAVDYIVETLMSTEGVTLLATGPLTNIAAAINREPRIAGRAVEVAIMGGSATFGNWTPAAEFNIFVDPEAAHRVFESGMRVKMCGLNMTRQCFFTRVERERIRAVGTRAAGFAADLLDFFIAASARSAGLDGGIIHDACPVAWLIDPGLVRSAPMRVSVELKGELTRGMTVCDCRHLRSPEPAVDLRRAPAMPFRGEPPNAEVGLELDFPGLMELLIRTLSAFG